MTPESDRYVVRPGRASDAAELARPHASVQLQAVTGGQPHPGIATEPGTHAAIPPGALLQLALGHRTVPEVLDTWPDCLLRDRRTEQFLAVAFPRVSVQVWPRN
ncbi:hypothetical protein GAR05_04646 [Micromonospora saelicesensis]|uniref:GNAT family N-acetyltransferase n=1 Tax=Micromonospora saelicesensis TaxID=285676 RepID=A0ABX9CDL8_9ACTN|nr:hypothetical protein GAR05_04646 [Micromonospora saelicesensis]